MTKAESKAKFGVTGQPHSATRVMSRDLDHFQEKGIDGKALLVIDDTQGTITGMNVYDGKAGKGYDPEFYRNPLPAPNSDKWKEYKRKGYEFAQVADFDVLVQATVDQVTPDGKTTVEPQAQV